MESNHLISVCNYPNREREKKKNERSFIFLGFQFKVTLESNMNDIGQQTRGTIKIKFDDQEEDASLFEYESVYTCVHMNLFVLFSQSTLFTRGSTNSKTILIPNKSVSLKKISISFKKSIGLTLGIGLADQWNFRSVTVLDMQSHSRLVAH